MFFRLFTKHPKSFTVRQAVHRVLRAVLRPVLRPVQEQGPQDFAGYGTENMDGSAGGPAEGGDGFKNAGDF